VTSIAIIYLVIGIFITAMADRLHVHQDGRHLPVRALLASTVLWAWILVRSIMHMWRRRK